MSFLAPLHALGTYRHLRHLEAQALSREAFDTWQSRVIAHWLPRGPGRCRAFAREIRAGATLFDLPVMDKAALMADFAAYNQPGITREQGWAAFEGSRRIGPYHVGASTGTSGNRGLFVISERERYAWLGAMLAKTLPGFWRKRSRVAVILPLHTRLYDAANGFGPIRLSFFDLREGPEAWGDRLAAFDPTVIIAPPKILRHLARTMADQLHPERVIAGAETLDPVDVPIITKGLRAPENIYMATEGLLGTTCSHGRLHLNEDLMHFEFEEISDGLVSPVVTDFRRMTQAMVRYRMNDAMRLSHETCGCGRPHRIVEEIIGRQDDVFEMRGETGMILVTPDILRNAVLDADRGIEDFRIHQTGPARIDLILETRTSSDTLERARAALSSVCLSRGVQDCEVTARRDVLPLQTGAKLRRVERKWRVGA